MSIKLLLNTKQMFVDRNGEVLYAWLAFWGMYIFSAAYLTLGAHITGIRKVTGNVWKVAKYNTINIVSTGVAAYMLSSIPTLYDCNYITKIIGTLLVSEFWFYHSHVLLHYGPFYRYIHKLHHEYTEPYALTGMYTHPLEILLSSVPSVGLGPVLFGVTGIPLYIWMCIVAFNTSSGHSGIYLWPIIDGTHDKHHSKFNINYGSLGIFDFLYSTSDKK